MTSLAYVDASALVKLVVHERDSGSMLRWYIATDEVVTSRIGIVETTRASRRYEHDPNRLRQVLDSITIIECDVAIGHRAAALAPSAMKTLDAIHVATALELGAALDAFVTYDTRLAEAARGAGLPVVTPAV